MRSLLTLALLALSFCVPAAKAQTDATPTQATVYVYRLRDFYANMMKPSVFSDKQQLARMRNGRFVKLTIPVGEHTITSTFPGNGLVIDFKPGETYYLRLEMTKATLMHNARGQVTQVTGDQGKYEVSQLKPAEDEDLKSDEAGK